MTFLFILFFQAEDGIRDLVRSRGLGDVYKRQGTSFMEWLRQSHSWRQAASFKGFFFAFRRHPTNSCLLYTSDAADERSSVDLGGRRLIKKKNKEQKKKKKRESQK